MKRRELIGAIGALLAGGARGKAVETSSAPRIVVGQSAALSGPAGELGLQFKLGAELHFQRVNQQGGVGGRTFELRSLDDGYEPQRCVQNTRELIDAGALALFGYVGTATSLAALPLATAAQRLFFAPFTGSEAVRVPYNPLAFHLRASYVDETHAIVKHLTSVGIQRIGVFYQNDGDGKAGLLGVARALKLQYQAPAGIGFVERNSVDVTAAVKSIVAAKPDAIVQISIYRSCAAFIRAARLAGFEGVFYNISLVGAQALAQELGSDSRGVVISQVMPFPFAPTTRVAGEFLAAGKQSFGSQFAPSYGSMEGYIAAKTLTEGVRRVSGEPTPSRIATALESMRDFDMGGFRIDFGPGKHSASRFIDLTILTADQKVRR
jgi:branched-chain amino acid transport system substrate-binding protein